VILSGETPSDQKMHEYCQSELLNSNREKEQELDSDKYFYLSS
jgi:hypothetical protein